MDMEIQPQTLTPPGSPILGYSRIRDTPTKSSIPQTTTTEDPIFNCKGPILNTDTTFNSDGYFRQNELGLVIETLKSMGASASASGDRTCFLKSIHTFFGFDFDVMQEDDLASLVSVCRKRIAMIEVMAAAKGILRPTDENNSSYVLRLEIAKFSNYLIQNLGVFTHLDTRRIFNGLILTLGAVKDWPPSLQHFHPPAGNHPESHLFHINLELRWTFLVFFRLDADILQWILDDLLHLSYLKFKADIASASAAKGAFNCYCVKEFWAMLRILTEELRPNGKSFVDSVNWSISQMLLDSTDLFPVWVMFYLAQLSEYELTGERTGLSIPAPSSIQTELHQILKDWLTKNINGSAANITEAQSLVRTFLPQSGSDLTLVMVLWSHWLLKLDKGYEARNMDHYSNPTKWHRLVTRICGHTNNLSADANSEDAFHSFLLLLVEVINNSSVKHWRKLASAICRSITGKVVESFGERGLTRIITLMLCMGQVGKDNVIEMCQRLNEVLNFGKDSLRLVKVRGRCAMVLLLLHKSLSIESCCAPLMKTVDEIMGTIHRNQPERDIVMAYFDLVQNLPIVSPHSELEQSKLISVNLTPWLASCGANYLVRTLRILHSLFDSWILNTNAVPTMEKSTIAKLVLERTDTFIKQYVVRDLDSIDVEPFADLALDFTVFQKMNKNYAEASKLFQLFSISARTSPKVSEVYLERLIGLSEFEEWDRSIVSEIQLAQSWIRLVVVGSSVPVKLTARLLNPHSSGKPLEAVSSMTDNDGLLRRFFDFINSSDCYWTRGQLGEILSPLVAAIKVVLENGYDTTTTESVVRSSVLALRKVQLDKIYARNSQASIVVQILEAFVPSFFGKPPWDKLAPGLVKTLRNFLPSIFVFISSADWIHDPFLKRKLCDTFRFAFLGFVTTGDLDDEDPGLLIMRHVEGLQPIPESLLTELMTNFQQLTKEDLFMKRFLLVTLGFLKRKMAFTSAWLFGLVLEVMAEKDNEVGAKCNGLLANCIVLCLSCRDGPSKFTDRLLASFETTLTKHFSFRSKRFFDFFNILVNHGTKKPVVLNFLYKDVLPLLKNQVRISETKQGGTSNPAMRKQLHAFETNLTKTSQIVKTQRSSNALL